MGEAEHWTLYLIDTYILYKIVYIFIIIIASGTAFPSMSEGAGYFMYKFFPAKDWNRYKQQRKWWKAESAKNIVSDAEEAQSGGGSQTYSIKTWSLVLLASVFLVILAILFPSKTIDSFSNITMPSMFEDTILDGNKPDLFSSIFTRAPDDLYTVSANDVEDINFIRDTDAKFKKSNESLAAAKLTLPQGAFENVGKEGFSGVGAKKLCGSKSDLSRELGLSYECPQNLIKQPHHGECHNKTKSPCCQRYCPSINGSNATYHGDAADDWKGRNVAGNPNESNAKNWRCNTESHWIKGVDGSFDCYHKVFQTRTDHVYTLPVSASVAGRSAASGGGVATNAKRITLTGSK